MNYVHTLCWNIVPEIEKSVSSLYVMNGVETFHHILVDLGFPLESDEIPKDIEKAKSNNTYALKAMAEKYGSEYLRIKNVGVSQNWTSVYRHIKKKYGFCDGDTLICADPDERPIEKGWVKALGYVLKDLKYGWACLMMQEHIGVLNKKNTISKKINGYNVLESKVYLNWAQGGFSGTFLNRTGNVPYPKDNPIYGGIESASLELFSEYGMEWCILPEYIVEHTDYEKGSEGSSRLLREWKNHIIFETKKQITFEQWLKKY